VKSTLIVLAVVIALLAFTTAGWAGFRATTTRVAPGDPAPYEGHPAYGCVWCHIVER